MAQAYFQKFTFDEDLFNQTTEGRIFSEEGEIKWRKIGDTLRVVYLGVETPLSNLIEYTHELKCLEKEYDSFILWGQRYIKEGNLMNEWIEQQVPHRFVYPVVNNDARYDRLGIKIENWTDKEKIKEIKFNRYHSIVERSEEQ
ncbi:MAG: CRISPR-associated protein Csx19 [Candidatus Scalindua sp.]|nr:CRISPR-associated protein Csx19 [Candidatus Scalindua sp.]